MVCGDHRGPPSSPRAGCEVWWGEERPGLTQQSLERPTQTWSLYATLLITRHFLGAEYPAEHSPCNYFISIAALYG